MFLFFDEKTADTLTPADMAAWQAFGEDAAKVSTRISGHALHPSSTATVVSVRDGKRIMTDGPFIETKEQLGGYYLVDCENLDVALALAAKTPPALNGHVEVRPVMEFE
ncbi:MAG: YciI family protein [Dehalococcoidia bacterium]